MRALLVEDNVMNVELFVDVLEGEGHEVIVERDGVLGRARALAQPFDLIILDVQLPGLDGVAICRDLRTSGVRTPIIAVSSAALKDEVRRGMAAGFDAYLTKPISPSALRDAARRFAAVPDDVGA